MDALTAFFLGQLSLAILLFAFIKFFIFGEPPETPYRTRARRSSSSLLRHPRLRHKRSAVLRAGPITHLSPSTILSKTYYNVSGHQPETLDWFNVLLAQTLAQLRNEALHDDVMLKSLSTALNGSAKPDFLGSIAITEMALGDEFPIFSNCRIIPVDEAGAEVKTVGEGTRLLARLDVDLSDAITLGIETKLVLNYPLPTVAVLPVALAVSVVRFSGTLSISFVPATPPTESSTTDNSTTSGTNTPSIPAQRPATTASTSEAPQTTLAFSLLPDYRLDLSVRSLIGSRSRLQDVPKLQQLVEARIHAWLDERCVEPRYQQVSLPSMWPRKKNTRGGGDESDDDMDNVEDGGKVDATSTFDEEEDDDDYDDEDGQVTETERTRHAGNASLRRKQQQQQQRQQIPQPPSKKFADDSLEARMAAEGRILRAATAHDEEDQEHHHHHHHHQNHSNGGANGSSAYKAKDGSAVSGSIGRTTARSPLGQYGASSGDVSKRAQQSSNPSTSSSSQRIDRRNTHGSEELRMPGRFD